MQVLPLKQFYFKPSLIPSLVTLALLYIMISLGLWQLDRAEYKSNLQTMIESRQQLSSVELSLVQFDSTDWLYTPVQTYGTYDNRHQILLDNQTHKGQAGYSVLTPFMLNENTAILVNRGWVSHFGKRDTLPDIRIEHTTDKPLSGLLTPPPAMGLVLSENANSYQRWPAVLQYIKIAEIQQQVPYTLIPAVLTVNNPANTEFTILPIKISMRSEKHTAYAFQWFSLSLALLIIYIVVNTKRKV